jgi:hypothetical protein
MYYRRCVRAMIYTTNQIVARSETSLRGRSVVVVVVITAAVRYLGLCETRVLLLLDHFAGGIEIGKYYDIPTSRTVGFRPVRGKPSIYR